MQLVISNNDTFAPLSLDLSKYPEVADSSMDPADPSFSDKVISHSLLKEGGVLALEDLKNKELVFPLALNVPNVAPAVNLVPDPNFAHDTAGGVPLGWPAKTQSNATITATITAGVCTLTAVVTAAGGSAYLSTAANMAVAPATKYYLQAVANVTTLPAGMSAGLVVAWYDAMGNLIAAGTVASSTSTGTSTLSGSTTSPANAAYAQVRIGFLSTVTATGSMTVDNVLLSTSSTYTDGDEPLSYWTGIPGLSSSVQMTGPGGVAKLVEQINQILSSPGATATWQDDGMSQPTTFDLISGQFDISYNYRRQQKAWISGKLRLFAQPLGRKRGPRMLASASGVGPLLMISPYDTNAALAVSPTQIALSASNRINGLGGPGQSSSFGGVSQGSGGIFFADPAGLDGDAPAQLVLSLQSPQSAGATMTAVVPYAAVAVLPDQAYQPFIGPSQMTVLNANITTDQVFPTVKLAEHNSVGYAALQFLPVPPHDVGLEPTTRWAGQHRLFAIAQAQGTGDFSLWLEAGPLTGNQGAPQQISNLSWGIYDLGTFTLSPSQLPNTKVQVNFAGGAGGGGGTGWLAGLVMLPDNDTWFLNPQGIPASQYGYPIATASQLNWSAPTAPWSNTLIIDDTVGAQGLMGSSQPGAPAPVGQLGNSGVITPYSRGLVPTVDPADGPPIIAILALGQNENESFSYTPAGGSPGFVENFAGNTSFPPTVSLLSSISAQLWVLERTRYVFS